MRPLSVFIAALVVMTLAPPAFTLSAFAHDGVAIEQDLCLITAGPYKLHFAGYQPETADVEEFCENLPLLGESVLVFSFTDEDLRRLPVGLRVINETGRASTEPYLLVHLPPQIYPAGTLSTLVTFDAPGDYAGILTFTGTDDIVVRFPFSVGRSVGTGAIIMYVIVVLGILGGAAGMYAYTRRCQRS
jgi:hypothetical protein